MKATDLARLVSEINRTHLNALCGESLSDDGSASRRIPLTDAPVSIRCSNPERCFGGIWACPCFSGTLSWADINQAITLQDPASGKSGKVAVGVTIDGATNPDEENQDLPVVLAVGINYGQMGSQNYLTQPVPLWDATGLRPKLQSVVQTLAATTDCRCVHPEFPSEYHLVAANFFPWITQKAWSAFNAIEEMLLLTCFGYRDPHAIVANICHALGDRLKAIIFHGANNAMATLGRDFLQEHEDCLWPRPEKPDIVFCDNLSPNATHQIANAVRLCAPRLRREASERRDDYDC